MARPLRIQVISDVHFEFHVDDGAGFVRSLLPSGVDVLVAAGDLCAGDQLEHSLRMLCERYPHVVYVMGNHELYGHELAVHRELRAELTEQLDNLSWLDCSAASIDGVRFVGATLWFDERDDNARYQRFMNDFEHIPGFQGWVYEENRRARAFLEAEVRPGDVVVTHHLPSAASITPKWAGDPLNRFFFSDLHGLLEARQPAAWIHGHTHDSCDYAVGRTQVVCNPYGYEPDDLNPGWSARCLVRIPRERPAPSESQIVG